MKYSKILLYWILTNIIGSYFYGVIDFFFYSKKIIYSNFLTDTIEFIPLASLFSFIFSIPALIIFLLINYYYKLKGLNKKFMLVGNFLTSLFTFLIIYIVFYTKDTDWIIICFVNYTIIGLIFWFYELSRVESKSS